MKTIHRAFIVTLCAGVMFAFFCGTLSVALGKTVPEGGTAVVASDPIASMSPATQTAYGTLSKFEHPGDDAVGLKAGVAIRCHVEKIPSQPWDFQFQFRTNREVKKGEVLLLRFYARTLAAKTESGNGVIRPLFEKGGPPHDKSLNVDVEIPRQWKEFLLPFKAKSDFSSGGASAGFHLGFLEQTVEIADFELLSYGANVDLKTLPRTTFTYPGREIDAPWRKDAEKRIEQIRKGDLEIHVVDSAGRPVSDADVEIRMTRHAFGWGSAVVARRILQEGPDGDRYREVIEKYYNRVVFENDLKWPSWDNERNHKPIMDAVRWLRDRNIEVRGHCLVWPSWRYMPNDLQLLKSDPEALRRRIDEHVKSETTAMKDWLVDWDVINEPYSNHDVMDVLGNEEMIRWFKLARECDPDVNLYLNDYAILTAEGLDKNHQDHFEKTLRFLRDGGAPLGGIGMQGHFGQTATPPQRMLEILDRYAAFELPITITEHDIYTDDEEFQADFTRDFLTTMFSHPSVVAVLQWGFWENSHWRPSAAYYRADWSLTPAGQVWIDLVTKTWWTHHDGKTDRSGSLKTRGFLGDYEITVKRNGKLHKTQAVLPKDGAKIEIVLP